MWIFVSLCTGSFAAKIENSPALFHSPVLLTLLNFLDYSLSIMCARADGLFFLGRGCLNGENNEFVAFSFFYLKV